MSDSTPQEAVPPFDPDAAHQQRPRLRPVRGFMTDVGGTQGLGLADARQITDKVVITSPAARNILPLMTGEQTVDEIVDAVDGLTREMLEAMVAQLDQAGLLFGPTFDSILEKLHADFDSSEVLPPGSTVALADALVQHEIGQEATEEQKAEEGPRLLRKALDEWMAQALSNTDDKAFTTLPRAIIAPHIDYPRGWVNYAAVWGRMREVDRPDHVVVLGTNHFGEAQGVCACNKGYETPFGVCPFDEPLARALESRLGDRLFEHRYDHEREHSIELQIAWIQHCLGTNEAGDYCNVLGVLVHDPAVNNGDAYDGKGIGLQEFVDALKASLEEVGGSTLIISSADLSHVGPAFGDQQTVAGDADEAEQFRNRVFQHDKEMLDLITQDKAEELVAAMAWQQNPTRWCSTGNIVATMKTVEPEEITLLNYAAAMDPQGSGMVSSAALVLR